VHGRACTGFTNLESCLPGGKWEKTCGEPEEDRSSRATTKGVRWELVGTGKRLIGLGSYMLLVLLVSVVPV